MIWQDIAIFVIMIFFSYALVPQVIQGFREKKGFINLQTSSITFLGMYFLTFIYFTLELYFSTLIGFITGTLWFVLFIQRIFYKR